MGDYGDIKHVMAGDGNTLYGRFKQHFSSGQVYSTLVLLESIRDLHSDRAVTFNDGIDPVKFAEAGFAEAKLVGDLNNNGNVVQAQRYMPEPNRLNGGDGEVLEYTTFGQYEYTFEGQTSVVYSALFPISNGGTQHIWYYVSPRNDPESTWAKSIIKAAGKWATELHEEIYVFDNGNWQKNRPLYKSVQAASWNDVILDPAMKTSLINDVEGFFASRDVYEKHAVPWKRGIIVHGTPGCGKTISIKALMKAMQSRGIVSLYVKSFSSDRAKWSHQAIRSIFQHARRMAPCMLIFEDLDSLVGDEVRSYFLNEVDGLEDNHGLLMIGSTNHLERLDSGISKRPSRFDRKYHYRLPNENERSMYCNYWQQKLKDNQEIEFSQDVCQLVARLTDGFSFAYMKELFVQTLLALVGGRPEDRGDDLDVILEYVQLHQKIKDDVESGSRRASWQDVDVPAHLRANKLVRVLHRQVRALWKDMDSTPEDTGASKEADKKRDGLESLQRQLDIAAAVNRIEQISVRN